MSGVAKEKRYFPSDRARIGLGIHRAFERVPEDVIPFRGAILQAARDLDWSLRSLSLELEIQGYTETEIEEWIRKEFFRAAEHVIKGKER